jgi:hypothetical protein
VNAQPVQKTNAQTLSIVAIVISVLCSVIGSVVGFFLAMSARKKAIAAGEPTGLPTAAMIVAIAFLALNVVLIVVNTAGVFATAGR